MLVYWLLLIVFCEGYVVLSAELLAIRQLIPFVGSGTETVSIIIGTTLLMLAIGYYYGGQKTIKDHGSLRVLLLRNAVIALGFFSIGLSYAFLELFFAGLRELGITNTVLQATIYALCFLTVPVFLLGQTVPIISNFFRHHIMAKAAGKMLFCSTVGSFFGSVFSTLVIMTFFGVNIAVIVTCAMLLVIIMLLSKAQLLRWYYGFSFVLALLGLLLNVPGTIHGMGLVEQNVYSNVKIEEPSPDVVDMLLNNSASSRYAEDPEKRYEYIRFVQDIGIPTAEMVDGPKDILVIGAGGFTIAQDDRFNQYIFVDIDGSLQRHAELHMWKQELPDNITFIPKAARQFLRENTHKFDVVFVDAYSNQDTIVPQTITVDFFAALKALLKDDAVLFMNVILPVDKKNRFTRKFNNTIGHVFPSISIYLPGFYGVDRSDRPLNEVANYWSKGRNYINHIYVYAHTEPVKGRYSDNKNGYFFDK